MIVRAGVALFATVVLLLGAPALARADEPAAKNEAAAAAKARGDDALIGGRPVEALAAYKESYALEKNAAVLYNMGRANQALGNYPEALDRYEEFGATAPASVLARVPGLPGLLAEVRSHVATIAIAVDVPGATVKLGDKVIGTTPLSKPLRTSVGQYRVVVEKDGWFPYDKSHTFAAGVGTLDVTLHSKAKEAIVVVTSSVVGAKLRLDGRDEGTVPTEIAVAPGRHRLDLTRDGYSAAQASIAVAAGERSTVDVPMQKSAPITAKWWFWTGVTAVVLGAVATTIVLTTERDPDTGSVAPGRIETGLRF